MRNIGYNSVQNALSSNLLSEHICVEAHSGTFVLVLCIATLCFTLREENRLRAVEGI